MKKTCFWSLKRMTVCGNIFLSACILLRDVLSVAWAPMEIDDVIFETIIVLRCSGVEYLSDLGHRTLETVDGKCLNHGGKISG